MRRISLLLMTLLCCFSVYAQDSRWELNAFVRPNISDYKNISQGSDYHKKFYNTDWGLEAKFHFNTHLRLVSGVGLATRRYDDNYFVPEYYSGQGTTFKHYYFKSTTTSLRVPLKLEYIFFPHDKVRFFINAGFISNYLLKEDLVFTQTGLFPNRTYNAIKDFDLEEDLVAGAGCEIGLNKRLSLYIEPTYEHLAYNIHYGTIRVLKTYSYGLQTGVGYRF